MSPCDINQITQLFIIITILNLPINNNSTNSATTIIVQLKYTKGAHL